MANDFGLLPPPGLDDPLPWIQARHCVRDPKNGLGDRYNPDWDYIMYPRAHAEGRIYQGWTHVADIGSASGEDLVLLGRPKQPKETP